ncbi:MAG TPA: Nif3-like dinuclear metal center hexameric protein [Bacteroidales bacterium]|nr:Nif3-like dinuclear metal center hexameric protein [Bacteroidales bacterium]
MKIREICSYLDNEVPLSYQEGYDNSGIQTGESDLDVSAILLTIDVTEAVVDEAISSKCNLIISHHPLIFQGVKRITDKHPIERILLKCIKNIIAVYSAHTNLDTWNSSVSMILAEKLGLKKTVPLIPAERKLMKLVTYIPESHLENVRNAIFEAGAGEIGNYDKCGYTVMGTGSFRGNENSNPFAGKAGEIHFEKETRFETVLHSHLRDKVVNALLKAHPYEEVAYDLYQLENFNSRSGIGCIGEFSDSRTGQEFLRHIADITGCLHPRYSGDIGKKIRRVAVCGGAGEKFIRYAIASDADAYITGDIKYHSFFESVNGLLIVDAGHFETEKYSTEILKELIIKKFPKFALRFSKINTNPINYF